MFASEMRKMFLTYMISLFENYPGCVKDDDGIQENNVNAGFDKEKFLKQCKESSNFLRGFFES